MSTYQVVEKFVSINGEGRRAGELAAFIRFKGCNLQCSYCDTSWANEPGCESERLTEEEILSWIRETGVKNVTLTGGEPLLRKGMEELIEAILEDPFRRVEIETNGSVDLKPYHILKKRPSFTMDYKAPARPKPCGRSPVPGPVGSSTARLSRCSSRASQDTGPSLLTSSEVCAA